jgi:hypothetical protein
MKKSMFNKSSYNPLNGLLVIFLWLLHKFKVFKKENVL